MSFVLDTHSKLIGLFVSKSFSDTVVSTEDQEFHLHRSILSLNSIRFSKAFTKHKDKGLVELDFSDDQVVLTTDTLTEIAFLARFFKVPHLTTACAEFAADSTKNTFQLNTQEILAQLHSEHLFSDYTITLGNSIYPVHKAILGTSCQFFPKLWGVDPETVNYDVISDLSPCPVTLKSFISSLYGHTLSLDLTNAYDLFNLSSLYTYDSLHNHVVSLIKDNLNSSEWVLSLMERADADSNRKLIKLVEPAFREICSTKTLQSSIMLKPQTLLSLTSVDIMWRVKSMVKSLTSITRGINWLNNQIEEIITLFYDECSSLKSAFGILFQPLFDKESLSDLLFKYSVLFFQKFDTEFRSQVNQQWIRWCFITADQLQNSNSSEFFQIFRNCGKITFEPLAVTPFTLMSLIIDSKNLIEWRIRSLAASFCSTSSSTSGRTSGNWTSTDLARVLDGFVPKDLDLNLMYSALLENLIHLKNSDLNRGLIEFSIKIVQQHSTISHLPFEWFLFCLGNSKDLHEFEFFAKLVPEVVSNGYFPNSTALILLPQQLELLTAHATCHSSVVIWLVQLFIESWKRFNEDQWSVEIIMAGLKSLNYSKISDQELFSCLVSPLIDDPLIGSDICRFASSLVVQRQNSFKIEKEKEEEMHLQGSISLINGGKTFDFDSWWFNEFFDSTSTVDITHLGLADYIIQQVSSF
ncbi:hypothetical protein GEMRC1_010474 [Eukaryota sp. GEM-RC1]